MFIDEQKIEEKNKLVQDLNETKNEEKAEKIVDILVNYVEQANSELINKIKEDAERCEYDKEYQKSLNLRVLNKEEKEYYNKLKSGAFQSVTAGQIDVIPTTIIERTLEDVKKDHKLFEIVDVAPAGVSKWILAEKNGSAAWGDITAALSGALTPQINSMNLELGRLSAYLVIPKAISQLALPFIDKYFKAILSDSLIEGLEDGFLNGTGVNQPIGILKQIDVSNQDGTKANKDVSEDITNFKPKTLAPALKELSNNGKRVLDKLFLVCNPMDKFDYVNPAILDDEGRNISSYKNLEVVDMATCPQGKAAFVVPKKYTLGITKLETKKYEETKSLEDADLIVAKGYGNGRAVDNSVAFVFDPTKLEEYVQLVKVVNAITVNDETVEGA